MVRRGKPGYLYIMSNQGNSALYTGVTSNLPGRVFQHKSGIGGVFSSRYRTHKLVYYEVCEDIRGAIEREKQVKGGSRKRKVELIESMNPGWRDLSEDL